MLTTLNAHWHERSEVCDFPAQLGRYRLLDRLGKGGMGDVFLAYDLDLDRRVAIKLLRDAAPMERLQQEAHLQARVQHPAVCPLYQIGEHQGRPYLVMRLIQGKALDHVTRDLDIPTRLRLMATLAEGVHAAHLQGLIHRDLKPSNMLVERDEAGALHPYITDFGLARDEASGTLTQSGMIMGTPAYMAPEQIQGGWMDARTDVYGLGATLFEILTGEPPFAGHASEILVSAQTLEAPRLRTRKPDLSRDLETLVQKCLEKDPARRYGSAQALAQDLHRYLEGRPIEARPPSLSYRLLKWRQRNRKLAWTAAVLSAALIGVSSWGLWALHRTRLRAALAERFGKEAEVVDTQLRLGWMAPPHDVRPQVDWARERLRHWESERRRLGSLADGPAYAAMGRIELNLAGGVRGLQSAREKLLKAWHLGVRTPDMAMYLGQVHLHLYVEEYQAARKASQGAIPAADVARLDQTYRFPALEWLNQAHIPAQTDFLKGLVAFVEDRPEDAMVFLRAAHEASPWDAEPLLYQALSCRIITFRKEAAGDLKGARASLDQEAEAYRVALNIERSRPMIYEMAMSPGLWGLLMNVDHDGRERHWRQQIQELSRQGLLVNPEDAQLLASQSELSWQDASNAITSGAESQTLLNRAIRDAERAVAADPENALAEVVLARGVLAKVDMALQKGEDVTLDICRAQTALEAALQQDPQNRNTLMIAAYARFVSGLQLWLKGQDPRSEYSKSIDLARIVASDSSDSSFWGFVGSNHNFLAEADLAFGASPAVNLQAANQAEDKARPTLSQYFNFLNDEARTYRLRAAWELAQGRDPSSEVEKAQALQKSAIRLNPGFDEVYLECGETALIQARWELRQGRSPLPMLRVARLAFQRAEQRKANSLFALQGRVRVALMSWDGELLRDGKQALDCLRRCPQQSPWFLALQGAWMLREAQRQVGSQTKTAQESLALLKRALEQGPALKQEFEPYQREAQDIVTRAVVGRR